MGANDNTKEVWRQVPSVPTYAVSNLGRIMRLPWIGRMPHGGPKHYGGEPTYGVWIEADKRFCTNIKGQNYKIARLVCEAFHGAAPADKPVCMHLDENPQNNRPENLAWGTQKENLNAPGFLEYCRGRTGENNPRTKGLRAANE